MDPKVFEFIDDVKSGSLLMDSWQELVEWSEDSRIAIGPSSLELVHEYVNRAEMVGEGLSFYPATLSGLYRKALYGLLARSFIRIGVSELDIVSPDYFGSIEQRAALLMDVSDFELNEIVGIASKAAHWSDPSRLISFLPEGTPKVELCFVPKFKLDAEFIEAARIKCSNRRLHVVGGKRNLRVIDEVKAVLGFATIDWIESEYSQPPRGLDKKWGKLKADRDVAICITGRIGHPEAEKAEKAATGAGVAFFKIESANSISSVLIDHFK